MKIIYDLSMLGASRHDNQPRGGIFRVVENVALRLASSNQCELTFCATNNTIESLDYLKKSPMLNHIPFSSTLLKRFIGRNKLIFKETFQLHINQRALPDHQGQGIRPLFENWRRPLGSSYRLIENFFNPIDSGSLNHAEIFHSPFYSIPSQVRRNKKMKKFLTIYDLIPILYPPFCEISSNELVSILSSVNGGDYIFCVSQSTKNDLCDYLKIDPQRVFVTYIAASPQLFYPCRDEAKLRAVRKKYGIPADPYLLSLGLLEPRKNINHSIRCFANLLEQEKIKDLNFVLVGAKGWGAEKVVREVGRYKVLKDRVFFTNYVEDQDLSALYSGAMAFIYPSFYEGFGLPLLEAMQCGTPVVASNTSSMPEVVGDAGILVPPSDANALCQGILDIYQDPSLRQALSLKATQQSSRFSWEKTTRDILAAYRRAISN